MFQSMKISYLTLKNRNNLKLVDSILINFSGIHIISKTTALSTWFSSFVLYQMASILLCRTLPCPEAGCSNLFIYVLLCYPILKIISLTLDSIMVGGNQQVPKGNTQPSTGSCQTFHIPPPERKPVWAWPHQWDSPIIALC